MEENLDRADENTSRLSSELQQLEKEREEAQHSLRTLENSESQIAEKADTQVRHSINPQLVFMRVFIVCILSLPKAQDHY